MLAMPALDPSPLPGWTCYADSVDAGRIYVLAQQVKPAEAPVGGPDFLLMRWRNAAGSLAGGTLRMSLTWAPVPGIPGFTVEPVPYETLNLRLVRRVVAGGVSAPIGDWVPGQAVGPSTLVVHLDSDDAQLVTALLQSSDLIDVQVSVTFTGLRPGRPWLATTDRSVLLPLLGAALPTPATRDQIAAAFASLPIAPPVFSYSPLSPSTVTPSWSDVADDVTDRSLGALFTVDPVTGRYLLDTSTTSGRLDLDLLVPFLEQGSSTIMWSVSSFAATLTEAQLATAFPALSVPDPFQVVDVIVICDVPFDPKWLQAMDIDLNYPGSGGVPEQKALAFPAGGPVQRVTAVMPPGTGDLSVGWRAHARLAAVEGGWPQMISGEKQVATGPVIVINRSDTGLEFVRVDAEPAVFTLASAVTVQLLRAGGDDPLATVILTATQPGSWVAFAAVPTDAALVATITAEAADDGPQPVNGPVDVGVRAVTDGTVHISMADLAVPPPTTVTVLRPDGGPGQCAFVSVTLAREGVAAETRDLEPGEVIAVPLARSSIFQSSDYRYQVAFVPLTAAGTTLPLVTRDWVETTGADLVINPVLATQT